VTAGLCQRQDAYAEEAGMAVQSGSLYSKRSRAKAMTGSRPVNLSAGMDETSRKLRTTARATMSPKVLRVVQLVELAIRAFVELMNELRQVARLDLAGLPAVKLGMQLVELSTKLSSVGLGNKLAKNPLLVLRVVDHRRSWCSRFSEHSRSHVKHGPSVG
jgi:hypothetical protein